MVKHMQSSFGQLLDFVSCHCWQRLLRGKQVFLFLFWFLSMATSRKQIWIQAKRARDDTHMFPGSEQWVTSVENSGQSSSLFYFAAGWTTSFSNWTDRPLTKEDRVPRNDSHITLRVSQLLQQPRLSIKALSSLPCCLLFTSQFDGLSKRSFCDPVQVLSCVPVSKGRFWIPSGSKGFSSFTGLFSSADYTLLNLKTVSISFAFRINRACRHRKHKKLCGSEAA